MGALDIVNKLKTLASDPAHRAGIVNDQGMLPTLVVFLENGDETVVSASLDVLSMLAQEPACRGAMRAEPGLLDKLTALRSSTSSTSSTALQPRSANTAPRTTQSVASAVLRQLEESSAAPAPTVDAFSTPKKQAIEVVDIGSIFAPSQTNNAQPIHDYTLFVKGLHGEEQSEQVEKKLLNVKGILSFWINIYAQKVEIRARIDEKTIIASIKEAGFSAVPWTGEGSPHGATQTKKAAKYDEADYLDENEDPQHSYGSGGWLGTLALFGASNKKKKTDNESLLGKLTSSWW